MDRQIDKPQKVQLVWITPNAEATIAHIARVSSPENQDNPNYVKLIKYLIAHSHWSPFEMVSMCLSIKTSRAISAQMIRHRSFSWQEFSQRYSEIIDFEPIEIRKQSNVNRQSSLEVFDPSVNLGAHKASKLIEMHLEDSKRRYKELVESGVAKEIARLLLPMTTQTHIYMAGNIRSFIHYITLRTKDDVQKEHRLVAEAIKGIFIQQLPILSEALDWSVNNE